MSSRASTASEGSPPELRHGMKFVDEAPRSLAARSDISLGNVIPSEHGE